MGSFLALLGVRLGLALVSWGLGSAGGDGPVPVTPAPGCMTLTVTPLASMTLTVTPIASMALTTTPLASLTLTVEAC